MSRLRYATLVVLILLLGGCATWRTPTDLGDQAVRARAVTQASHDVRVSAALLSPDDCRRLLGTDLDDSGIQPVWLEVRNETTQDLWLLRSGTGPDYFTPLEAAWSAHTRLGGDTNDRIDEHFERVALPASIPAGETRRGILFVAPQPVRMLLNVDLVGDRTLVPLSLLLHVPGEAGDAIDRQEPVAASVAKRDYRDLDTLRPALEHMPDCAATADDGTCSQPLNLIVVGSIEDVGAAISRRGFRRDFQQSDLALQLFGRPPDFVARRRAYSDASALWIRAWLAPLTYQGAPVFVAQVAWPAGGRFDAAQRSDFRLHGDIDSARDSYIQDSMYSGGLHLVGFLPTTGAIPASPTRSTRDGATYYTDGHRAVLFYETRPLTVADVQFIDWVPLVEQAEARAKAGAQSDGP